MRKLRMFVWCAVLLCGCSPREKFSEIPHIEFVGIEKIDNGTGVDSQAELVVHFQDGDGNIGLDESDTTGVFSPDSLYYYNFFIEYYEKQQGKWVSVELPTPLHVRVPVLSQNVPESIEGDIKVLTYINNLFSPYDTVKLSCYLVDRDLNKSNVIETPEITVNK